MLCLVATSCPTHCDLMDWSLPGSSVCGVLQARILKWVAISSSRGSSWSRDRTYVPCVSCIAGGFFTCWAIREAHWCFGKKQFEAKYKDDLKEISVKQWRRQWHPTPVLLPRKSHGRRSLVGCSPWGHKESDMTEWLHFHFSLSCIGERNGNPLQCSCLENPRDGGAWWAAVYGVA